MADEELGIFSSSLTANPPSKIATQNEYEDHTVAMDNCEFVKRISILSSMDDKRCINGSADKAVSIFSENANSELISGPPIVPRDKKRRKVVIVIATVTIVLLIMSILLMVITIQITPSIDEKIRKEHQNLVKKMSEGAIKQQNDSRVNEWQEEWNKEAATGHEKELLNTKTNSSSANAPNKS